MAGFIYFVPGGKAPLGDTSAFPCDSPPASADIARGPDGSPGCLVWEAKRLADVNPGYFPDSQTWRKCPGGWVGTYHDCPPSPDQLARGKAVDSCEVTLAGRRWLLPRLRVWVSEVGFVSALPMYADVDDNGDWIVGEATPRAARLDAIANRWYQGIVEAELEQLNAPVISRAELLDGIAELLAVNYAVGKTELAMMRALTIDDTELIEAAAAAIDLPSAVAESQGNSAAPAA